ncbi:Glutaredoxin [Moritella sp. JT01]|uniref:glutathione S-transferase N-terminal domain-containing protein n=1 Tax=unclassified Moritella TaxID=2637987 RepID=UPI00079C1260|nr:MULTISPECIES: glutathione S-transferase N-terminal domain-containing protein [unclassified Moritella]KXO13861.1 Glutaredoxin [Moritella sp. JT01]QUM74887.1 glutathione S-transferase N-terminal domain-containing protein [Moritella sp. 24]QUM86964.1 glutathione S-transferase N-terminal domain-containing protein [Moritella sp. 28]QUM91183.1 glutathione S-transferase N-terminal domain-containing protein [Moritella sp. 36]
MKVVRWLLGRLILTLNFIFTPKSMKRPADAQAKVDSEINNMSLYQFEACPFCVKVRRSMKRLNLDITVRDAKNDATFGNELEQQGGKRKVPCLRIEENGQVQWMYESSDIIAHLEKKFA